MRTKPAIEVTALAPVAHSDAPGARPPTPATRCAAKRTTWKGPRHAPLAEPRSMDADLLAGRVAIAGCRGELGLVAA